MTKLDKLDLEIDKLIAEINLWKYPKGMRSTDYRDGRDHARGAFDTCNYLRSKIKSLRRAKRKSK